MATGYEDEVLYNALLTYNGLAIPSSGKRTITQKLGRTLTATGPG